MRMVPRIALAALLAAASWGAWAQDKETASEGEGDAPGGAAYEDLPALDPSDTNQLLLQAVNELTALRESMEQFQATMADLMESRVRELEEENARLRQALELQRGSRKPEGPAVPSPDRQLVEEILSKQQAPPETESPEASEAPAFEKGEFDYTIVKEWGRSPEEAQRFDGTALKGMVLAVPQWASDDQLVDLGMELRQKYEEYSNINIEVFKTVASAQRFAQEGRTDPGDRVLNISRFEDEGRDVILLIRGEEVTEIDPNAPPVVAGEQDQDQSQANE